MLYWAQAMPACSGASLDRCQGALAPARQKGLCSRPWSSADGARREREIWRSLRATCSLHYLSVVAVVIFIGCKKNALGQSTERIANYLLNESLLLCDATPIDCSLTSVALQLCFTNALTYIVVHIVLRTLCVLLVVCCIVYIDSNILNRVVLDICS